jgi:hypothetical protein
MLHEESSIEKLALSDIRLQISDFRLRIANLVKKGHFLPFVFHVVLSAFFAFSLRNHQFARCFK